MIVYALIETGVVAALVGGCALAAALRLLPVTWLKAPLGAWLDRSGHPLMLGRMGARWRIDGRSGCAIGCCVSGDGCAIGRNAGAPVRAEKRIPLTLESSDAGRFMNHDGMHQG